MSTALDQSDSPSGLTLAVGTYVFWGFLPLFMKQLAHIPPAEVIAHRIIWSLPIALAVLLAQRKGAHVWQALRNPRLLAMAAICATLISVNWLIYVWSIANDRAIEAALGYYINPLFSVFLGATLLGERLNRMQIVAIVLAAAAVLVLTVSAGRLPLVALGLTFSWGFYAYFKRRLPLGPNQGFTMEVLLLLPLALGYVIWLTGQGQAHFATTGWHDTLFLLGCGPVTAIPLLMYANAAKQVRLSTMGVLQYIAPTMIFLTAVFVFGETFRGAQMIAFPMIWASLVIYSVVLVRQAGARRRMQRQSPTRRMQ
ncbi:MAG: EamA family transporter RarD [Paracoccus sp. (in: a-proteobacteria)]|uniref:EamA family transporter RarD n=1 Tax=Paracoccus sp. TaxID=267 RepID=UPI0026DF8A9C|nr:EamA family transporter RarD [Paracoccus sp. (in: a-proteobacteria)]MDO5630584.1 EamA family transporter RarD [Paracoccus sp. (in: a-proteobacteria)]